MMQRLPHGIAMAMPVELRLVRKFFMGRNYELSETFLNGFEKNLINDVEDHSTRGGEIYTYKNKKEYSEFNLKWNSRGFNVYKQLQGLFSFNEGMSKNFLFIPNIQGGSAYITYPDECYYCRMPKEMSIKHDYKFYDFGLKFVENPRSSFIVRTG